ncbi:MAG: DUF1926 domain-containing protein [Sphaerochaetaceae bacterium]|nr:DUF1926 domain-containing protein [Sphaerochaetaceae bacterium]
MIIGAYSHIPPGTPPPLLETLLSDVYKPLLTYIYNNPSIKIHLYLSAVMLEWFETNHPEINMLIADLVKKDQLELLTGPYYQSILPLLFPKDRSRQIEATTTFIRKRFGKRPKTLWLPNQIWSSHIVPTMHMCSVDRVMISTFSKRLDETYSEVPFSMQDTGKVIEVYPVDTIVESLVNLFRKGLLDIHEFEEYLDNTDFSDRTHDHVIMVNLHHLLQASTLNSRQVSAVNLFSLIYDSVTKTGDSPVLLNSVLRGKNLTKIGYLPSATYGLDSERPEMVCANEMLTQYGELNHLYGRLMHVSELARLYKTNKDVKKRVEALLMKSQSGGPFLLDSSGGCYRSEYRQYIYKNLNEAERLLATYEGISYPREVDLDFDGNNEIVCMSRHLLGIVNSYGGVLSELNYLPTGFNYCDTFTGYRDEAKRSALHDLKEGTSQSLFNDVFINPSVPVEEYSKEDRKKAYDCASQKWDLSFDDKNGQKVSAFCDFDSLPFNLDRMRVEKSYQLKSNSVVLEYTLTNIGTRNAKGVFATEMNISLGKRKNADTMYTVEKTHNRIIKDQTKTAHNLNNFRLNDDQNKTLLSIASNVRFNLFHEEYSLSVDTMIENESLYQYSLFLLSWPFDLKVNESKTITIGWRIERKQTRKQKEQA